MPNPVFLGRIGDINPPPQSNAIPQILGLVFGLIQQEKERKRENAGLLMKALLERGGTLPEGKVGEIEKVLGSPAGLISSLGERVPETITEPTLGNIFEVGSNVRFSGAEERALKTKEKESEIEKRTYGEKLKMEEPYRMKEIEEKGKVEEKLLGKKLEHATEILTTKLDAQAEALRQKLEANDKIWASRIEQLEKSNADKMVIEREKMVNALEKQSLVNEVNMAKVNAMLEKVMNGQPVKTVDLYNAELDKVITYQFTPQGLQPLRLSKENVVKKGEITENMKLFKEEMIQSGYMKENGTFKNLSPEQLEQVRTVSQSYGFDMTVREEKGMVLGPDRYPVINYNPRVKRNEPEKSAPKEDKTLEAERKSVKEKSQGKAKDDEERRKKLRGILGKP